MLFRKIDEDSSGSASCDTPNCRVLDEYTFHNKSPCSYIFNIATALLSPSFFHAQNRCARPCRLERASKARLAWSVENPGSKANKRRTLCTTNSTTTLRKLEGRLELRVPVSYGIAGSRDGVCTPGHISEGLFQGRDRAPRSPLSRRTRIR